MSDRTPIVRVRIVALLVALATLAVYSGVGELGFVDFDDGPYVTKNPEVNSGLTLDGVAWAFTSSHSANWHPLTWLSHMLDCELFGLDPSGHHWMAAGLHALNAALCLLAFFHLSGKLGPSLVVAALFAFHPLRVESVAWIAERKDLLSGTFFFLTLIAYARYVRTGTRASYLIVALALALGLLAKQMLVTLPVVLLLLDVWPLERWKAGARARLIVEKLPLVALCAGAGVATLVAQSAGSALRSFELLPLGVRLSNAVVAYASYLGDSLWPTDLAVFYPHPWLVDREGFRVLGPRVLASGALLVLVSGASLLFRRRLPWLVTGWLWYLVTLLPVIGIVQVGAQWMADRYAYLTLVGVYAALAFSLYAPCRSVRARSVFVVLGLGTALAFVPATRRQVDVWKDTRTLFEHALDVTDRNYVAHANLGFLESAESSLDAAERHFLAAIEIAPGMPDPYNNLGGIYLVRGDYAEAEARLRTALKLNPDFVSARVLLGRVLEAIGEGDAALAEYRRAVQSDPRSIEAAVALGRALVEAGETNAPTGPAHRAEAIELLARIVRERPASEAARVALAEALNADGRPREALDELERALRRDEPAPETLVATIWLLSTSSDANVRNPERALELARGLDSRQWTARRAVGAAYAAAGQFEIAARALLDAEAAAPENEWRGLRELHELFRSKQALYR